jgi:hypothetical protein
MLNAQPSFAAAARLGGLYASAGNLEEAVTFGYPRVRSF